MSLAGVRARVTIEAVQGDLSDRSYRLVASSSGTSSLVAYDPDLGISEPSGLVGFETQENFQAMTARLDFAAGPTAAALQDLVKPNDLVMVEIAGADGDDEWSLVHLGLVSSVREVNQVSPSSYRAHLRIESEGIQKLFNQSIFNWQGVMSLGDDRILGVETRGAYRDLLSKVGQDGITLAPSEVIQALVKIGVSNSIKALVHGAKIEPGGLFGYASDWGSLYAPGNFPLTAAILWQNCSGTFWAMLQQLAEPDIHEFFWTIRRVKATGEDKPTLVHRPRPFPDGGGQGDLDWMALKSSGQLRTFGRDGRPAPVGYMRQVSDAGRVNAFHWGQEGFQNTDGVQQTAKLTMGWWCDQRAIKKYGFAPRRVSTGLLPQAGQNWLDLIGSVLRRVAYQEAPLYLMGNESRAFAEFLPGVHPGMAMEDWSRGKAKPTTGYISSVTQSYRSTERGIHISSSLGLSRCIRDVTFEEYPKAAAALSDMTFVKYQFDDSPHRIALQGAKGVTQEDMAAHPVASSTGIRYADLIKAAANRQGVPSWFLAKLFQNESTFGTNPKANVENSATALGPMQITRIAFADAVGLGYRTPSDRTATLEDRRDVATSLDMAAFLVAKRYKAGVIQGGCPQDSPNFWRYVADAYNRGADAAVTSGRASSWASSGLVGYGLTLDVSRTQDAFGGIA